MKSFTTIQAILVVSALTALSGAAQDIFVLPAPPAGVGSPQPLVINYSASALTSSGQFVGSTGAVRVISDAAGDKFYVLSTNAQSPLVSVSNNYATVKNVPGVFYAVTGAVMTPDDSALYLISESALLGFNTANDTAIPLPTQGLNVTAADVDVSLDGAQVFALFTTSFSNSLEAISISTHKILNTLQLPVVPTALVVGPDGLIYVSGQNTILQVDPNSYTILRAFTINGTPGKLAFTPDGHYAIANNMAPSGSAVAATVLDLQAHTIAGTVSNASLPQNTVLNSIWPINNTTALAYVRPTRTLYTISLSPLGIAPSSLIPAGKPVVDIAVSNDLASGTHPATQYLFYATTNTLNRVDIANGASDGGVFPPTIISGLSYTSPALTGTPAALLQYGNNQQVPPGATSQPLVVRAVDINGNFLSGVAVTFQGPAGVQIANPTVTTNALGYATTTFVAPSTTGPVSIQAQTSATQGNLSSSFGVTVGNVTTGAGVPAALKAVAGQGEIQYEVTLASSNASPLTVQVVDANGDPVPNTPVTFQLTKGQGTLVLYQGIGTIPAFNQVVMQSDKNGMASCDLVTHALPQFPGFDQEIITASIPSGISLPLYFTTVSHREPATIQLVKPQPGTTFSGPAGTTVKGAFQFRVFSNSGPGLPNVSMRLIPTGDPTKTPSASCAGTPLSDASGLVTCDLVFNGIVGVGQVTPQAGYLQQSLPFTVTITAGPPAQFQKTQGDNQTGKPNQKLLLAYQATLVDAFGNILTNVPVTWSVTSGSATITSSTPKTDKNGITLAYVTLGAIPGPVQITVSAGPTTAPAVANFASTVVVTPGGLKLVSGNNQTANIGAGFEKPLVVQALDDQNNPIQGVSVAFAATSGDVTLSAASAVTDSNGNATVNVTAGATAGPAEITATYATFNVAFQLKTVFPGPSNVTFYNGATFQVPASGPGSIAPGEIVSILGSNLTPGVAGVVTPPAGPLPTTLNGVQVLFGGVAAPLFAVVNQNGLQQINALVPFELGSVSTTTVTIINSEASGTILNVPVQPLSPGFFASYVNNQQYAVLIRATDGSYIGPKNLAKPGETLIAFVNGLGQGTPTIRSTEAGSGQTVNAALAMTVNGVSVGDVSAIYQSQVNGIYLVTFKVPASLQAGIYPVTLSAVGPDSNTYTAPNSFIPVGQ